MPGIGSIRILPGGKSTLAQTISLASSGPKGIPTEAGENAIHGGGPSTIATPSPPPAGSDTLATTPVNFSVQSPAEGIELHDSVSQNNNNIVLVLRTLVAGQNIEISTSDGQIVIESITSVGATGPTGPAGVGVFTPIIDGTILGNVAGAVAPAIPITLTDLIDHSIGSSIGAMLARNSQGWSALSSGPPGYVLHSAGGGVPSWQSLGTMASQSAANVAITGGAVTAALNATSLNMSGHRIANMADPVNGNDAVTKDFIEKVSINFSLPDKTPPALTVQVGITRPMQLRFGDANPLTYCIKPATAASVFTLKYVHSGVTSMIGTITFGPSAVLISSVVTVLLLPGDVLQLITPPVADATLADVLLTVTTSLQ